MGENASVRGSEEEMYCTEQLKSSPHFTDGNAGAMTKGFFCHKTLQFLHKSIPDSHPEYESLPENSKLGQGCLWVFLLCFSGLMLHSPKIHEEMTLLLWEVLCTIDNDLHTMARPLISIFPWSQSMQLLQRISKEISVKLSSIPWREMKLEVPPNST